MRFRRYDLATGAEIARWPCGTIVRCAAFVNEARELIVATDKRLARLDAATLVETGRWDRSAKYADSIAVVGNVAVVANWKGPTVALIDLESGEVRRRRHREMTLVLARGSSPLLVDGGRGGVSEIDPRTGVIEQLLDTPPAFQAALSGGGTALWLTTGVRVLVTPRPHGLSLEPGAATFGLERHDLGGENAPLTVELPLPVRTIATSSGEIWLTPGPVSGEAQHVVTLTDPPGSAARVWRPEPGELIAAVDPTAGLVLTSRGHDETLTSTISCFRLAD